MSGHLRDLASWALRGGAGNQDEGDNNEAQQQEEQEAPPPMTAEELRAQRLARMEATTQMQQQQQQETNNNEPEPMDIDEASPEKKKSSPTSAAAVAASAAAAVAKPSPSPPPKQETNTTSNSRVMKKAKNHNSNDTTDDNAKLQRRKELLLKKTLHIILQDGVLNTNSTSENASVTVVDIGTKEISTSSIAEILATRLTMGIVGDGGALAYLGACYNRIVEENKNSKNKDEQLRDIGQELAKQIVNYAATCLVEPDLFPAMQNSSGDGNDGNGDGNDAHIQLVKLLLKSTQPDPNNENNIVFGGNSSFYARVMEEWNNQSPETLKVTIEKVIEYFCQSILSKIDSVLDGGGSNAVVIGTVSCSAVTVVTALANMCLYSKAAASVVVHHSSYFLLPADGTPEATILHGSSNIHPLQQWLTTPRYAGRSGPALEKRTLLGSLLKIGLPRNNNPNFPPNPAIILRQSPNAVESAMRTQRQQLNLYQNCIQNLIMALIKVGKPERELVMQFFQDALLVNRGADALRPDPAKVSSSTLRLNLSVVLLKLIEPIVKDGQKKLHLIDAGYVSASNHHGGVFETTGDDAVPRLGRDEEQSAATVVASSYTPKNPFVPQCFFLCARSLHLSMVPLLSSHENLLRNIAHYHYELDRQNGDIHSDPRFSTYISRQRSDEVPLFQDDLVERALFFSDFTARALFEMPDETLKTMPESFVSDICDILLGMVRIKPEQLRGIEFRYVFKLVVKLLSAKYASMVRNYNLRAQLGDVLHELFLPRTGGRGRDVPASVATDPLAGGQTYLLSDAAAQESLAPSLLLLYGEVEHTGYYDKMSHRAKIASLIKYLWESAEHRPAFRRITQNKESFIKFANGIMNETNALIATVMQKLPEIRSAQERMKNTQEWGRLSEEEQNQITSRLDDNERDVKSSLPLCNKTLQMFGYLNTDKDIRNLFLLDELCSRLVTMLLHVLTKLVGSKGLDLKVDNPEQYEFKPKEMLRDLCAIFALFASSDIFQVECAKSGCNPDLLSSAVKTCRKLNLLTGESMEAFESLPKAVEEAVQREASDEALLVDAPDEFLDEILATFMKDPVILPSGHYVDRSTITQQLLNDPIDPFNREPLTIDQVQPAFELREKMNKWLEEKRASQSDNN